MLPLILSAEGIRYWNVLWAAVLAKVELVVTVVGWKEGECCRNLFVLVLLKQGRWWLTSEQHTQGRMP